MSQRIISCQVWEWYGSEDFAEGRYKAKGGQEFVYLDTPESEAMFEEDLIDKWNATFNCHGQWYRYEAKDINYYFEPRNVNFIDGVFSLKNNE